MRETYKKTYLIIDEMIGGHWWTLVMVDLGIGLFVYLCRGLELSALALPLGPTSLVPDAKRTSLPLKELALRDSPTAFGPVAVPFLLSSSPLTTTDSITPIIVYCYRY